MVPLVKIINQRIVSKDGVLIVNYRIRAFPGFPPFINHDLSLVKQGRAIEDTWSSKLLPNVPLRTYSHEFSFRLPKEREADQVFIGIYFAGFVGKLLPGWNDTAYLDI